jgi:hypothetical protein
VFAAVRKYELGAGSAEDMVQIVEDGLAEVLSREPGFVSYHIIASGVSMTGGDEIVAVTIFDDAHSAARSNELAAEFVKDRLEKWDLHLGSVTSGPVILARTGPS